MRTNYIKKMLLALILANSIFIANCQKRGFNWVFGDSVGINFNTSPPSTFISSIYSHETNSSISDNTGILLLYSGSYKNDIYGSYSDNFKIWNRNNQIIQYGDSIIGGYSATNGSLFIPFYNDTTKFYLFNIDKYANFYYSVIQYNYSTFDGNVFLKNNMLSNNVTEKLIAVKHANGRDWWILLHEKGSDRFIKYLVINDEITGPFYQAIGNIHSASFGGYMGEMDVTSNGDRLAVINNISVFNIFDFDRCTGDLSNFIDLSNTIYNSNFNIYGLSFNEKGDKVYLFNDDTLFQYNFNSSSYYSNKIWVYNINNNFPNFSQLQLAPDGKIYVVNISSQYFPNNVFDTINMNLSVINNPDGEGVACDFQPFSFYLGGRRSLLGLPNMPNYNLGALEGSSCDTIVSIQNKLKNRLNQISINVYPNPANDHIFIGVNTENYTLLEFRLYNIDGKEVLNKKYSGSFSNLSISTKYIDSGMYFYKVIIDNQITKNDKIVIIK